MVGVGGCCCWVLWLGVGCWVVGCRGLWLGVAGWGWGVGLVVGCCGWGFVCVCAAPKVSSKGYPQATCDYFEASVQTLKESVLTFQKSYARQIVACESALSMEVMEQDVKELDSFISDLSAKADAYKKGLGKDIKNLST